LKALGEHQGQKCVVCFGEIMMRLSPPGHLRFHQTGSFDVQYGGGEANVAVGLANFGVPSRYLTRLPDNALGRACAMFLSRYGVDVSHILWGGDRLGLYFLETGAMQRASRVVYDRNESSLATISPGMIDWDEALKGAGWFHWTGITPAVSRGAAETCLEGLNKARALGLVISCDLNYRAKLWNWGKGAGEVMQELVGLSDVAVGNEEDAEKVFNIRAPESDVTVGEVPADKYRKVAEELIRKFPNLKKVGITLRGSLSASHNTWSGIYFDGEFFCAAPVYQLTHIVDRVGAGDAFAAGLIHGLLTTPDQPQRIIDFAVAASCLKHSVFGDFNAVGTGEVEKLITGDASGRVVR
jgi:2-dehydro-3-deoxygluconokinase